MAVDEIPQNLDGKGLRIGIVIARFNEYAGRGEYEYCLGELKRLGVAEEDITVCHVRALSRSRLRCSRWRRPANTMR